jgi:multidrug efflux system membrane fusion protein
VVVKKLIFAFLLIVISAVAGYWYIQQQKAREGDQQIKTDHTTKANAHKSDPNKRPAPVFAANVTQQDFPIWLNALGTATARNLVTVKSRIDGELMAIHFEEGQAIKKGQLLAEIDPRNLQAQFEQQQSQYQRDQALLNNAQLDLKRYQQLAQEDAIASQQVDTQAALVKQYQATLTSDKSQMNSTQLQLSYTKITAPISGKIGFRQVDAGNQIKASDASGLVTIAQLSPITVIFSIPENKLADIKQAISSTANLKIEAWDKDKKKHIATGRLLTLDNQIDSTTGSIRLKAIFDNNDEMLYPNQFVNIRLQLKKIENAITIPATALQHGAKGDFVYVINDDNTASVTPINIIQSEGDFVAVEGKLNEAMKVVTDGADKVKDGAMVKVITKGDKTTQ